MAQLSQICVPQSHWSLSRFSFTNYYCLQTNNTHSYFIHYFYSHCCIFVFDLNQPSKFKVFCCLCDSLPISSDSPRTFSKSLESAPRPPQKDSAGKNHQCITSSSENSVKLAEKRKRKLYLTKKQTTEMENLVHIFARGQLASDWREMHSYKKRCNHRIFTKNTASDRDTHDPLWNVK